METTVLQPKDNAPDPRAHAAVMIECCRNWNEALELARLNCDYSPKDSERDYWDKVAIEVMRLGEGRENSPFPRRTLPPC